MLKRIGSVGLFTLLFTLAAAGQTTVTTTAGGTVNQIPVFSGSSTNVENSAITDASGSIGIGTTTPLGSLHIQGASTSASHWSSFNYGKELIVQSGGANNPGIGIFDYSGANPWGIHNGNGTLNFSVMPSITDSSTLPTFVLSLTHGGNVGIGTSTPGATLEVDGNVKLTSGSGASVTYPDSTVQSTAWTGTLTGGDYAESMDVTGSRSQYEPGDVLMLDPAHPGHVVKATERYSLAVAGVYSTKPGVVGRRQKIARELATTEVPMAMVGVVPTKVSAENGPIHSGDVLVASSTPGYAMKGTDRSLLAGAVIGKAMASLDSGTGMIEVLISLQ